MPHSMRAGLAGSTGCVYASAPHCKAFALVPAGSATCHVQLRSFWSTAPPQLLRCIAAVQHRQQRTCASIQQISASLSSRHVMPRGPLRVELKAMGMSSARGRAAISLTRAPLRSHSWMRLGNLSRGGGAAGGRRVVRGRL